MAQALPTLFPRFVSATFVSVSVARHYLTTALLPRHPRAQEHRHHRPFFRNFRCRWHRYSWIMAVVVSTTWWDWNRAAENVLRSRSRHRVRREYRCISLRNIPQATRTPRTDMFMIWCSVPVEEKGRVLAMDPEILRLLVAWNAWHTSLLLGFRIYSSI